MLQSLSVVERKQSDERAKRKQQLIYLASWYGTGEHNNNNKASNEFVGLFFIIMPAQYFEVKLFHVQQLLIYEGTYHLPPLCAVGKGWESDSEAINSTRNNLNKSDFITRNVN